MSERKTLTLKTASRLLSAACRIADRFWMARCCLRVLSVSRFRPYWGNPRRLAVVLFFFFFFLILVGW
jgi:hypothetical protein